MSDPADVLFNSPRSKKACETLGISRDELQYLTKEELKAKLGKKKLSKNELQNEWENYESQRKDKIAKVLDVSSLHSFPGKEKAFENSQQ